jgi:hypothetical protein
VPVVVKGAPAARGVSFRDASAEDARVRAATDALGKLPDVRRAATGRAALDALAALKVAPDVSSSLPLVAQHRRTATGQAWFLYNDSARRATGTATFATDGAPVQIDPYTGDATRLARFDTGPGRTALPIDLGPGETMLLAFARNRPALHVGSASADAVYDGRSIVLRDTAGGAHAVTLSDGRRRTVRLAQLPAPIAVGGPWALQAHTVAPDGDGAVALRLDELADWRDIPELQHSSGTGTYTATVNVPASWLAAGRGVLLDPGAVGGMYTVAVDGRTAVFPDPAAGARDVTALLHPGDNALRITVATTLNNVIAGRAQSGDARYAVFATRATQPYGLLGPVKLVPFAQATAATVPAACASRRAFPITVRAPRGFRPRSATLRIGSRSRPAKVRRAGRRLRATVSLRGLPKGRVRVRLTVRGTGGRTVRTVRRYRLCAPRRR